MKELSFKIQGEFVCHLARSWFWDENREYEKCEELLLSCLMTDEISEEEKKKIVVEILEGRKILVGVNELELVEDGERIRPLADKFKEYQKKEMIRKIEEDIQRRPLAYLDPYSCDKNINEYKPVDNLVFDDERDVQEAFGRHLTHIRKSDCGPILPKIYGIMPAAFFLDSGTKRNESIWIMAFI